MVNPRKNEQDIEHPEGNEEEKERALEELKGDVTEASVEKHTEILTDEKNTKTELVHLGGDTETHILAKEILNSSSLSLSEQVDYFISRKQDTTVEEIETNGEEIDRNALYGTEMQVGFGLMGAVYKKLINATSPERAKEGIDVEALSKKLENLDLSTPQGIEAALQETEATLTPQDKELLHFLKSDSKLAQSFIATELPAIATAMQQHMPTLLTHYNEQLDDPDAEKNKKKRYNYVVPTKKEVGEVFSTEAWKKDPGKNAISAVKGIVTLLSGGYVAKKVFDGIRGLFGGKKEEQEEKKESGFFMKMLKYLGITAGAGGLIWLITEWMRGNNPIDPGPNENVDRGLRGSTPSDYEATDYSNPEVVSPEKRELLDRTAGHINELFLDHQLPGHEYHSFGAADYEILENGETTPGLTLEVLNKRYGSVAGLLSGSVIYKEILGSGVNKLGDSLRKFSAGTLKAMLEPMLKTIDGALWGVIKTKNTAEQIADAIDGKPDAKDLLMGMFRKVVKLTTFLEIKKQQLPFAIARQHLEKTDPEFSSLDKAQKQEQIETLLEDPDFIENNVDPVLKNYMESGLSDDETNGALTILKTYEILDSTLPEHINEQLETHQERYENLTEKEGETDIFDYFYDQVEDGKLHPEATEKFGETLTELDEHMETVGRSSWYSKYIPLLSALNRSNTIEQDIFKQGGYDKIILTYKQQINTLRERQQEGTLSSADITKLQTLSKNYHSLLKQIELATLTQLDIQEGENGTSVVRGIILQTGETYMSGFRLLYEGATQGDVAKIGSGLGMAAGSYVSVGFMTYPIKFFRQLIKERKIARAPLAVRIPMKVAGKLDRTLMPHATRQFNRAVVPRWYYKGRTEHLWYDVAHGRVSLKKGARIAKKLNVKIKTTRGEKFIKTPSDLLKGIFGVREHHAELVAKYWDNTNIRKTLLKKSTGNIGLKFWRKWSPEYTTHFIRNTQLKKLQELDAFINQTQGAHRTMLQSMTKYHKNLDNMIEIASTKIPAQYQYLFNGGDDALIEAERLGRYLGKYGARFDTTEFTEFFKFLEQAKKQGKITNTKHFIRNTINNWTKLKSQNNMMSTIESLKLNSSPLARKASRIRRVLTGTTDKLNKITKNPRLSAATKSQLGQRISNINKLRNNLTPETAKAWMSLERFNLPVNPGSAAEYGKLARLVKQKDFLRHLKKASSVDDVKALFKQKNVQLGEEMISKFAQSKSTNKIKDLINYGQHFEEASRFKNLMNHPTTRLLGRVAVRALFVTEIAFAGYEQFQLSSEQEQVVSQFSNELQAATIDKERTAKAITQGVMIASSGIAVWSTIGGLATIPGAGWIAAGVGVVGYGAYEAVDAHYTLEKWYQTNEEQFKTTFPLHIKQQIIEVYHSNLFDDSEITEKSAYHGLLTFFQGEEAEESLGVTAQTTFMEGALRSLLFFDELYNYPAANFSTTELSQKIADEESKDPSEQNPEKLAQLREDYEQVKMSKIELRKAINRRINYLEKQCDGDRRKLLDIKQINEGKGIQQLEQLLTASKQELVENYHPEMLEQDPRWEQVTSMIDWMPHDVATLLLLSEEYKHQEGLSLKAENNISFFQEAIHHYLIKHGQHALPQVDPSELPELAARDDLAIKQFFETGVWQPTTIDKQQVEGLSSESLGVLTDKEIQERHHITGNIGQDTLYQIATRLFNYRGENKLFADENKKTGGILGHIAWNQFELSGASYYTGEIYGIYYDQSDNDLQISDYYLKDEYWTTPDQLDDPKTVKALTEGLNNHNLIDNLTNQGIEPLNKEMTQRMKDIAYEHLYWREHPEEVEKKINEYVKTYGKEGYITLPDTYIVQAIKAGISDVGTKLYTWQNGKVVTYTPQEAVT